MTEKKRISSQFEDEKRDAVDILMGDSKPSKPGYKRQTYIVREDHIEKIRAIAYWERREITEIINELLEGYLKDKKADPVPGGPDDR